ncbi:MAG: galactose-1-phosphate uridylyltransferase [Cellulosilyticaceae bacterium]
MPKLDNEDYSCQSVIFAEQRDKRPTVGKLTHHGACPFCEENKMMLEHVWLEKSTLDDDVIRIVNNKYPICTEEETFYGVHDVVIDTLFHHKKPFEFSKGHWQVLVESLRERYLTLWKNSRIQMIQIFKNNGCEAGASIAHSHWQIVALEQIPNSLLAKYQIANQFYKEKGYCKLCNLESDQVNLYHINETTHWRVVAPDFSCMSHETWIVPKQHISHFGQLSTIQCDELADVLGKMLCIQEQLLSGVHYNICFMGSLLIESPGYHFHIRILPRKGQFAGFELATGCCITSMSSIEHSKQMRDILRTLEE